MVGQAGTLPAGGRCPGFWEGRQDEASETCCQQSQQRGWKLFNSRTLKPPRTAYGHPSRRNPEQTHHHCRSKDSPGSHVAGRPELLVGAVGWVTDAGLGWAVRRLLRPFRDLVLGWEWRPMPTLWTVLPFWLEAREERIVELETENAALHLRLAQVAFHVSWLSREARWADLSGQSPTAPARPICSLSSCSHHPPPHLSPHVSGAG